MKSRDKKIVEKEEAVMLWNDEYWSGVTSQLIEYRNDLKNKFDFLSNYLSSTTLNKVDENTAELLELFDYIFDLIQEIMEYDLNSNQNSEIELCLNLVDYFYERVNIRCILQSFENYKETNDRINKQQGVQFATFSIFLTILSFVLSNVILIAKIPDIKTIVLCNLSILLFSSVLLTFISVLMKLPYGIENKNKRIWNYIVLCVIILMILVGIIVVAMIL